MQIHERCGVPARFEYSGIDALSEYRFEWDEENLCFSKNPLHNWASHSADAFRYMALVGKHSELMTRKPDPAKQGKPVPISELPGLNQLFEDRERSRGSR
jgi:phage terminase large subunit